MQLNSIEEIIEDIRQGKMVILMDDEDRENEGDLVMAASQVRPEDINFMARYGRGLICLPMTRERCEQLNLPLMSQQNGARFSTNFTVSIEASEGVSTGISAADRARTVQMAVAPNAKPSDIVQPGHIFPIMAKPGGVLNRAGHTEASCDLARLAGFEPAAVIVEILNEDGTMARRPDLEKFAQEHGLKMGTIADLIEYRSTKEKTVEKVSECHWPTEHGEFRLHTYRDTIDGQVHFALVKGNPKNDTSTLVRVHLTDSLGDLLEAQRGRKPGWGLSKAIERIGKEGEGVVVVLANKESSEEVLNRIHRFEQEDKGEPLTQEQKRQKKRTVGIGSQILAELGVHKMRLLSSGSQYTGLAGYGLEIVENIAPDQ
ncbi:bifunctional 3,4-dihydroxy-2-butanone-4-phosphate synthase/GTP cyclohydrolase II [Kangiella koreensis]|uniref:3,4-dihydroxy-2-butanone 4-phosphate synthase n=1 Tax=Kangiella koreensis (strain DSM 16069 / JCM 12317 / KCTC 12182 / SW-125) TaxID=523791 RepID=C7R8N0_KANKD|nr:bifunctional 3,4-dihydroxy-2-butanone-4-phosphate synthase/GTP cyclohydrolase II [Kangiella koreensis]ACV25893.1 3,4-dihydroxy-2-butanone 4-phosphate synthase [Kangiella koreensis DSM 16069]